MKMLKTLSMTAALLGLTVGFALAAGNNLAWQDCAGGSGVQNRAFACGSNSGNSQLISSFVAPANLTLVSSMRVLIRMQTANASLGTWWDGVCRGATAVTFGVDFSGTTSGGTDCFDYFAGASGGGFYVAPDGGPNRASFRHGAAYAAGFGPVAENAEVYTSRILLGYTNTLTCNADQSCNQGACLHLDEVEITQVPGTPGGNVLITNPALRNWVTWQGGGGLACPDATPTRKASWGTIKSLYR